MCLCAQVRRDLKLLLGSNLPDVINAVFPVIACRKPANTILAPNRFVRLHILGAFIIGVIARKMNALMIESSVACT
jgi:hypothetical protein